MFLLAGCDEKSDSLRGVRMATDNQCERDCSPELEDAIAESQPEAQSEVATNRLVMAARRGQMNTRDDPSPTSAQKRLFKTSESTASRIDIRLLVRRREAGALIGKQGANIKRMRDQYRDSSFNIPDTGNGPERIVCISSGSWASLESILLEIGQLFLDKSCALNSTCEDQVELKQLVNSAFAGLLIGMGGQSIRKLRNDSKAAIKIYEMCCPSSEERVCAIKARPPVVVGTIRMIHELMLASQSSIKAPLLAAKPYDALNFDPHQVEKYGGHLADDCGPPSSPARACMNPCSGLVGDGHLQQHHLQHSNMQHLIRFDPLARADVEPIPLVVSSPLMFRPGTFLSPVHAFDFAAPLHPIANSRQFMPFQALNKSWPRFGQIPPPSPNPAKLVQDQRIRQTFVRATSGATQLVRSQRFHPYESHHERSAERPAATRHRNQAHADRANQQQAGRKVPMEATLEDSKVDACDERPAEGSSQGGDQ